MSSIGRFDLKEVPTKESELFFGTVGKAVLVGDPEAHSFRHVPLPEAFLGYLHLVKDLEVRDDDVWLITYPKCGTTFASEMIWLLVNDLDFEKAKEEKQIKRLAHIESAVPTAERKDFLLNFKNKQGPRVIRSHLPVNLLPSGLLASKAKIIYVTRNPKDCAISYFHHMKSFHKISATLEEHLEGFLNGKVVYGSIYHHVREYQVIAEGRKEDTLVVSFEDMKSRMKEILKEVSEFLGKSFIEDQLAALEDHLQFDKMRKNNSCNMSEFEEISKKRLGDIGEGKFMRKGEIGSHKDEMPEDFIERFDFLDNYYTDVENETI